MIKLNKVGMSFIGLFILIAGCENDTLELTPFNGQTLRRIVFTLAPESKAVQESVLIGSSGILYAGYVESDKLSTILISLDYEHFLEEPICLKPDSLQDIGNIQFEFKSLQPLRDYDYNLLLDSTRLNIGFSSDPAWAEESDLADSNPLVDFNWTMPDSISSPKLTIDSLDSSNVFITDSSIQIIIVDSLKLLEWCNAQNQNLIIEYKPELNIIGEDELKLLEFYSSEFTIQQPQISFDYSELKEVGQSTNKFLIDTLYTGLSGSAYIINNPESEEWSRIYLLNENMYSGSIFLDDSMDTYASLIDNQSDPNVAPIIDSLMLNREIEILKLTISLNDEIIDSIDTFGLSILDNSITGYSNLNDLSGDNYGCGDDNFCPCDNDYPGEDNNEGVIEGSECNGFYELGEQFFDFGIDKCPDYFEDGNGSCLVLIDDFDITEFNCVASDSLEVNANCIYNTDGSEGNGILDCGDENVYECDTNQNGIWDLGEGEQWADVGSDGCIDIYEDGNQGCQNNPNYGSDGCDDVFEDGEGGCFPSPNIDYDEDDDPNGDNDNNSDNYLIDPEGDDWNDCGSDGDCSVEDINGTQSNQIWDIGEGTEGNNLWDEGEEFLDIGCDGIPQIIDSDSTQNNGNYDICLIGSGEYLFDTGIDGEFNLDEDGFNDSGTEGNSIYNFGESTDAGKDGCFNQFEDGFGGCLDYENIDYFDGNDPNADDYNIDPNDDNLLGDSNGIYDEGEYFYDYGIDGLSNSDEVFSEVNFLNIGTGTNTGLNDYPISRIPSGSTNFSQPIIFGDNFSTNDAVLWISNINHTDIDSIVLTFSIYATKEVKYLSFSLTHRPLDWIVRTLVSESFSSNNYNKKYIDDISIYEINSLDDSTQLTLNYGHGITSNIDFINIDSLKTPIETSLVDFIHENRNSLLSEANTQLVIPIDIQNSMIDEWNADLVLSWVINGEIQQLSPINISKDDEHIIIPMRTLLQRYVNGQYVDYSGFKLSLDGSLYNFSNIILEDSIYLETVYSK